MKKLILVLIFIISSSATYAVCCGPFLGGMFPTYSTCKDGKDKWGCCGALDSFLAGCYVTCCHCSAGCRTGTIPECEKWCQSQKEICENGCLGEAECLEKCQDNWENCVDKCD